VPFPGGGSANKEGQASLPVRRWRTCGADVAGADVSSDDVAVGGGVPQWALRGLEEASGRMLLGLPDPSPAPWPSGSEEASGLASSGLASLSGGPQGGGGGPRRGHEGHVAPPVVRCQQ